mgnify:CR=1 FL=1
MDVDVGVSEKSANLLDVNWSYPVIAMGSSHCLGESNERLELSDSDLVSSLILGLLSLSDGFVLLFQNHCRLFGELRVNGPAELDIGLYLLHLEIRVDSLIL